jgi:hypothetical protein
MAHGEVICFVFKYDGKIMIPLLMTCFVRLNPISQACAIIVDVHVFQFEEKNNMFGVRTFIEYLFMLLLLESFSYLRGYLSSHLHMRIFFLMAVP